MTTRSKTEYNESINSCIIFIFRLSLTGIIILYFFMHVNYICTFYAYHFSIDSSCSMTTYHKNCRFLNNLKQNVKF